MLSLYAQSFWYLIKFDMVLASSSFAALYRGVKTYPVRCLVPPNDPNPTVAVFQLACIWYPKQVRCLQRSAALTCLLRNNGISAHMVIGTQKFPFKAHAWVEVERHVMNDKEYTPEMYAVLDRC